MNLSEILPKRAISWSVRLQTTLKHCAVADSRFFDKLYRIRLDKNAILTSFQKLRQIPLQLTKSILMFLLSKEHTRGLDIHKLCELLSLRIHYVTIKGLNV